MLSFANLVAALEAAPADRDFVTFWIDEDERESVTFGEFRRRAQAEAESLRREGLGRGDRVVIIMPQGIAAMTTFIGAMMLGAVPAFLAYPNFKIDPAKYRSGLAGVTANLGAKAVIIDEDFPEEMLACVSMGEGTRLVRARNSGGNESAAEVVETHSSSRFERARLPAAPLSAEQSERLQPPRSFSTISPDSLAFIQHSAGTTGLQKGVALTHAAVLRQIQYLADALKVDPNSDRIYSWLPLYHDMGLIACFMLPLVCHVPLVMQPPLDWVMHPETMLQIVSENQCTLAWMPNFAFQFLARRTPEARRKAYDLSPLRLLINCSEPVRATTMDEFRKAFGLKPSVLQSSYAMAENVFAVTQSDINSPPPRLQVDAQALRSNRIIPVAAGNAGSVSFVSSGRPLPKQQIQIVSDSGDVLGDDSVGEIAIRGHCLFSGYYNRPDLTAAAMIDGWYRTGDLGFVHDNEVYVVGRKKDLLIVGGENIYPQDIEEIVGAHAAIHDGRAIAIGVYNPDLGTEDIVVVAEVENESSLYNSEELERELRSQIVGALGIAVRMILLKPPKWIVKSTAGKPARSATKEKLLRAYPDLNRDA